MIGQARCAAGVAIVSRQADGQAAGRPRAMRLLAVAATLLQALAAGSEPRLARPLAPSALAAVSGAGPDSFDGAVLRARLLTNTSTRSGAVAEVEHASVPPETTWFHLRPAVPPPAKPDGLIHSLWFARTPPKPAGQLPQGVQQISFDAACEFAAGCDQSRKNFSFIVEAWSDRDDLGGPGTPVLLAQSARLRFHFDDLGFASGMRFTNFTAVEHGPAHVTISCLPNSATLYAMAEQITWFGYGN